MPIEIHADEAAELQEARINVAHDPWMRKRHLGDDVSAEPVDAALGGEIVDGGRIAAGVGPDAPQPHPDPDTKNAVGVPLAKPPPPPRPKASHHGPAAPAAQP